VFSSALPLFWLAYLQRNILFNFGGSNRHSINFTSYVITAPNRHLESDIPHHAPAGMECVEGIWQFPVESTHGQADPVGSADLDLL
jgi:hypothetical protein